MLRTFAKGGAYFCAWCLLTYYIYHKLTYYKTTFTLFIFLWYIWQIHFNYHNIWRALFLNHYIVQEINWILIQEKTQRSL